MFEVINVIDFVFFCFVENKDDAVNKFYVCDFIIQRNVRYYVASFYMRR